MPIYRVIRETEDWVYVSAPDEETARGLLLHSNHSLFERKMQSEHTNYEAEFVDDMDSDEVDIIADVVGEDDVRYIEMNQRTQAFYEVGAIIREELKGTDPTVVDQLIRKVSYRRIGLDPDNPEDVELFEKLYR